MVSEEPLEEQPPHYLVQRVKEALAHDERVAELELKVKIYGRKVFVTGTVPTPVRCDAVDEVLRVVLPGFEIHNETTTTSLGEPTDVETLS